MRGQILTLQLPAIEPSKLNAWPNTRHPCRPQQIGIHEGIWVCKLLLVEPQVQLGTFILGRFAFYVVFWGDFDLLILQLKVMPRSWFSGSKQIWSRSFNWGTTRSCRLRGYKISEAKFGGWKKICQRGRIRIRRSQGQAELADFFSISNYDL